MKDIDSFPVPKEKPAVTSLTCSLVLQSVLLTAGVNTYAEAHQVAQETSKPLVVLVGADWCSACRQMKSQTIPALEKSGTLDTVAFVAVNSDADATLARQLMRGGSIPQLVMFVKTPDGWRRESLVGAQSVQSVQSFLERGVTRAAPPAAAGTTQPAEVTAGGQ